MSSNTENIEARLCAFVEGDLDETGRAEIEKHLETHPAHRALLEELKRTKSMMMSLPREQAPADLAETLQGHLERSVLLDGVGTNELEYASLKINRWPQFIGVAAVLALAVGLGVLVYVVLPQHSSKPVAFSSKDGVATSDSMLAAVREEEKAEKAMKDKAVDSKELGPIERLSKAGDSGTGMTPSRAEKPSAAPIAAAPAAPDELGLAVTNVAKNSTAVEAISAASKDANDRVFGGGVAAKPSLPAEPRRVYVVVSTDDLATTNGQLANYLSTRNIAWQPANRGALTQVPQVDVAVASRANQTQYQLNANGNDLNSNGTTGNAAPSYMAKSMNKKGGENYAQQYNQYGNNYNALQQRAPITPGEAGAQQRANAEAELNRGNVAGGGGGGQANQQDQQLNQAGAMQQAAQQESPVQKYDLAASKTENVIIARGLTRSQAAELGESLDKLYAGQTSVLVDRDAVQTVQTAFAGQKKLEGNKGTPAKADADGDVPATMPILPTPPAEVLPGKVVAELAPAKAAPVIPEADSKLQDAVVAGPTLDLAKKPATQPSIADQQASHGEQKLNADDLSLKPKPTTRLAVEEPLDVVIVVQPAVAIANRAGEAMGEAATTQPTQASEAATVPAATVAPVPNATVAPPAMPSEDAKSAPAAPPATQPAADPADAQMAK